MQLARRCSFFSFFFLLCGDRSQTKGGDELCSEVRCEGKRKNNALAVLLLRAGTGSVLSQRERTAQHRTPQEIREKERERGKVGGKEGRERAFEGRAY